ncbi:hypothetical protein [Ilumatobacter coccineus]|uniref:hypothetical protein n=1 Tax=Ilumatobacter coccineus TaxID=467094 RepID=UPI000347ED56|nr:hypothetical protein [Ilumatobacter coccineus]
MTTIQFAATRPTRPTRRTRLAARRRRPSPRRVVAQLRRLARPPRPFTTPTDHVLRDLPEARSMQR